MIHPFFLTEDGEIITGFTYTFFYYYYYLFFFENYVYLPTEGK
jgi:hypothetical protein